MTPSEIADWLDRMSDEFTDLSPAAATIRKLEASNKARADIIYALSKASEIDRAKLKIATEALEFLWDQYKALANSGDSGFWRAEDTDEGKRAMEALDFIKETK